MEVTLEQIEQQIKDYNTRLKDLYNKQQELQFIDLGYKPGDYVHLYNHGIDYYIYLKNIWQDREDVFFEGYTLRFDDGLNYEDTFAQWGLWEQTQFRLNYMLYPSENAYVEKIDKITFNNEYQEMIGIMQENHKNMMNNGWKN